MADEQRYAQGGQLRLRVTFTNAETLQPIDPGAVYLTVRTGAGAVTTYQYGVDADLIRQSAGKYYRDVDIDVAGQWHYRWHSTGAGKAADERPFDVIKPKAA